MGVSPQGQNIYRQPTRHLLHEWKEHIQITQHRQEKSWDQPDDSIKGSSTSTLEISPKHINGTETLLVVSSFLGSTLKATVDLSDLSDPYAISILGSSIFKNGEGENKYTAKIYRAGDEIDWEKVLKWKLT